MHPANIVFPTQMIISHRGNVENKSFTQIDSGSLTKAIQYTYLERAYQLDSPWQTKLFLEEQDIISEFPNRWVFSPLLIDLTSHNQNQLESSQMTCQYDHSRIS
jgi:hypothetical protein